MKLIITEQQANEIVSSMLEDMFKGYEIKFEGDFRNVYVNGKFMAQLGPTSGIVSLDAFHELRDNLFFSSDKDLKAEVTKWIFNKFGGKGGTSKYGIKFKKLHGQEKDMPKAPRKPHGSLRQDKIEPTFDLQGFKKRTSDIETRLKNREDLIRVAKSKMNPDSFENWWNKEEKKELERAKKRKEEMNLTKVLTALKNAKKI